MKRIFKKSVLLIGVIILVNIVFVYFFEKESRQAIANNTHDKQQKWQAATNSNAAFDLVFLGSSRGYCAYNPEVLDSLSGTSAYNMCTSSQSSIESYYVLKDFCKFQKPKIVVYEIFLPSFTETTDFYHLIENSKFMTAENSTTMITKGFGIEGLANIAIPILKDRLYIKKAIGELFQPANPGNEFKTTTRWINGFLDSRWIATKKEILDAPPLYTFSNTAVSTKKIQYLDSISKFCANNGIRLICVKAPYPPSRLKKYPDNSESAYFATACKRLKIPFHDFNTLKHPGISYSDSDFTDLHHMNTYGAKKATTQLSRILSNSL